MIFCDFCGDEIISIHRERMHEYKCTNCSQKLTILRTGKNEKIEYLIALYRSTEMNISEEEFIDQKKIRQENLASQYNEKLKQQHEEKQKELEQHRQEMAEKRELELEIALEKKRQEWIEQEKERKKLNELRENLRKIEEKKKLQQDFLKNLSYDACGSYYSWKNFPKEHDDDELSQDIIKNKKYRGDTLDEKNATKRIAKKMFDLLKQKNHTFSIIIPVPNHSSTSPINSRAVSIAQELSILTGKPFDSDILEKTMIIPGYKKMSHSERKMFYSKNQVFMLKKPDLISNRNILLVDDVITTSLTLKECAKELFHGSPREIFIICAGKTKSNYENE